MPKVAVQTLFPIGQSRSPRESGMGSSKRLGARRAKEVERVQCRVLQMFELYRDEIREIRNPTREKIVAHLEKRGAVDADLFGYKLKRLHLIDLAITWLVRAGELRLDDSGVPHLIRDPQVVMEELHKEVVDKGMTSLKAQSIAHQRQWGDQKAS
jgi:hypothetical protein